ncbi:hypothetical protein AYJ66_17200 [Dietzia cinnamea]|nr:hypothetical protein AYJ66_17200 [Dietzia cinnamea]
MVNSYVTGHEADHRYFCIQLISKLFFQIFDTLVIGRKYFLAFFFFVYSFCVKFEVVLPVTAKVLGENGRTDCF